MPEATNSAGSSFLFDATAGTNYLGGATLSIQGNSYVYDNSPSDITWNVIKTGGNVNPILYFKYIKSKFNFFQKHKIDRRLKELEDAFNTAVENGQTVLAEKFLAELDMNAKETIAIVKGLKYWINREDLYKFKTSIKDGHISDTLFKDYTRIIPKRVIKEKEKYAGVFDDYVIFHYYSDNQKDLKKLSPDEKQKMRDPVLFGRIKGSDKFYFIADWEDEFCDLTFDEIISTIGKDKRHKIETKVKLATTTEHTL